MSNNDIVYIRNNNRYGGSRSFVGKTPPVAKDYITAKGCFSDTFSILDKFIMPRPPR